MKSFPVSILRCFWPFLFLAAVSGFAAETSASSSKSPSSVRPPNDDRGVDSALHRAALRGDADTVISLLATGADANARNQFGATPLHYGVASERVVAALLAHGARTDIVSEAGVTP